jgi:hypothetical protein
VTGTAGAPAGSGPFTATHGLPAADGIADALVVGVVGLELADELELELLESLPPTKIATIPPRATTATTAMMTTRTQGLVWECPSGRAFFAGGRREDFWDGLTGPQRSGIG